MNQVILFALTLPSPIPSFLVIEKQTERTINNLMFISYNIKIGMDTNAGESVFKDR